MTPLKKKKNNHFPPKKNISTKNAWAHLVTWDPFGSSGCSIFTFNVLWNQPVTTKMYHWYQLLAKHL